MSGLEAEGSGDSADLCPSLENQALPFLAFSVSRVVFGSVFFFFFLNQKHRVTVSPASRYKCGRTCGIREVSGFANYSGEKRQRRGGQ